MRLIDVDKRINEHCAITCGRTRNQCNLINQPECVNGCFYVKVLEAAPTIEAEPVRHEGNTTYITTNDLDKYQDMIIVDEGEKSKFCRVYYADNPGWEVFDDLASAYYGKQMYFTQPDGTIYSRLSCGYMTFKEALSEFREAISMDTKEDEA